MTARRAPAPLPPPRPPGWPPQLDTEPMPISPHQVELLGLGVLVTVLERMSPAERRRSLAYLNDRYGDRTEADR